MHERSVPKCLRGGDNQRGFASDRRAALIAIEIGIGIEIGSIGETLYNDPDPDTDTDPDPDPDPDPDLDRACSPCTAKNVTHLHRC